MSTQPILNAANISSILNNNKRDNEVKGLCEDSNDDKHGHLICEPGAMIKDCYKVVKKLGKGHYSRVVEVLNVTTNMNFALKIIKNRARCRQVGITEIVNLRKINCRDPNNTSLCVKVFDSFEYKEHLCITFEKLGGDIYHFMKKNNFAPLSLEQTRHIAYQLCCCVSFLHDRGIIHTDLKPDNILFVDSTSTKQFNAQKNRQIRVVYRSDIRLIDFGCAVGDEIPNAFKISNRNYRAPEVVLKSTWSHPVDIWSIGCILFELYTGRLIFNTEDNNLEHLAIMEKVLGPFPQVMAVNRKYFTNGTVNYDWSANPANVNCHKPLTNYDAFKQDDELQLLELIKQMLVFEPWTRITSKEALSHPFFDKLPSDQRRQ